MARSPLILAALAKAAKADLSLARSVALTSGIAGYYDAAQITDTAGENYVLRMPLNSRAFLDLQTELYALKALRSSSQRLPFEVPALLGTTKDATGVPAVLLSFVYGSEIDISNIGGTDPFAQSLGKALAAIHNLPVSLVEAEALPVYTASDVVKRKVALMDKAAATGLIPAALLQRWETALEDVNLFRFTPCVVHGEISGGTVLEEQGQVSGVLGWNHLHVGDPAEDLSWPVGYGLPDFSYSVLHAYTDARPSDTNLQQRAQLYSELAYAQWLLDAIEQKDVEGQNDLVQTLQNLNSHLAEAEALELEATGLGAQQAYVAADAAFSDDFLLDSQSPFGTQGSFEAANTPGTQRPSDDGLTQSGFLNGIDLGQIADESAPTRPMPIISEAADDQTTDEERPSTSRDKDELF